MKLVIKNGHLVDVKTGRNGIFDILVENGKVADIGSDFEITSCDLIDASGQYVVPGLVDAHCHLRDPGFEYKEDIESGTRSAAKAASHPSPAWRIPVR
jgi:Dihydroorotase and related cyclic amidohydrolases